MTKRISISEEEKLLRKKLGLPVTKPLRYMIRSQGTYVEVPVIDFWIVDQYQPSGSYSLMVMLEGGEEKRIFAPFFSEMQKPSFEADMKKGFSE